MKFRRFLVAFAALSVFGNFGCTTEVSEQDQPTDTGNQTSAEDAGGGTDSDEYEGDTQAPDDAEQDEQEPQAFLACPPLDEPVGTVVDISVDDVAELPQMIRTASEDTTFAFAPGTYVIDEPLHIRADRITLRSTTDDANDVVIDGDYKVGSLVFVNASDVTVAHLTLKRSQYHTVHISPPSETTEAIRGSLIYDVRSVDAGQQHIKINGNASRTAFVDEGRVECSRFELTDQGRPNVDSTATGCYTGGVDGHGARDWVIRNNEFVDIYCDGAGLAEHAVHFWTGSRDTLVEYNRIENCARAVGFGLRESGDGRTYEDLGDGADGYVGHFGGLIRNNLIIANIPWYDTGIELAQAQGATVIHNTIYDEMAQNKFSSIDYRFHNTVASIHNNLTGRISRRNDAAGAVSHNLEAIDDGIFVDATNRDFRLVEDAIDAIDTGLDLDEAGPDLDGQQRPRGEAPDRGAYEY